MRDVIVVIAKNLFAVYLARLKSLLTVIRELDQIGSIIRASRVIEVSDYRITITLDSRSPLASCNAFLGSSI